MTKAFGRKRFDALDANSLYRAFSRGLTFAYFTLSLNLFWSSWPQILRSGGGSNSRPGDLGWIVVWLGGAASLTAWEAVPWSFDGAVWRVVVL
jgi:hypothetical protein